ncbi:MAG: beta-ketoacyl synthase N-terminal-like domain-containing protein [Planctomycetota bacterium]|jgi:acyl transferase domain-containing protein
MDSKWSQPDAVQRLTAALRAAGERIDELERRQREPIAIIGMACRIPGGADDPCSLWSLLENGGDAVKQIDSERLSLMEALGDAGVNDPVLQGMHGAFLDHIDEFDPAFFGISDREATRLDPQHRMLLEVSWEALENAAIKAADLRGSRTGLYVGICFEDFAHRGLFGRPSDETDVAISVGSSRSLGVGRVAYTLDLHGPVLQLDTTCSSSLLAIHLAAHALRRGECNVALAGGVNALLAHEVFLAFQRMGALSRTGKCRTFDASSDGYVRGEGCGMVVLKPLGAAIAAGDHVWAVIEGSAVNHDGRSNGLTAPNGAAQEAVIREAIENAGVSALDVQYLEAHGTGTPLGDPIELGAATRVLCQSRPRQQPLFVGSIKTNVGHLEGAAGVAGVMKAALAIHHRRIPPNKHFSEGNERIDWDKAPVRVPTEAIDWPDLPAGAGPYAGVSSFGMSGTNVHIVLGPAPEVEVPASGSKPQAHVLTLSARTDASLRATAARYADALDLPGGPSIGDVCFTVNTTRSGFERRVAFVAEDADSLCRSLREFSEGRTPDSCVLGEGERVPKEVRTLARQFVDGDAVDWPAFYRDCGFRRVPFPSYSFDRKRLWLTTAPRRKTIAVAPRAETITEVSPADIRSLLVQAVADAVGCPAEVIKDNAPLAQLGIDSLVAADVLLTMECELGHPLSDDIITGCETIDDLVEMLETNAHKKKGAAVTTPKSILDAEDPWHLKDIQF